MIGAVQPVLWIAQEVAQATSGQLVGGTSAWEWAATGVSIDSRTTRAGDLFVALRGPHQDGHDYVDDALARGAVCALVHRMATCVADDAPLLVVEDTTAALADIGRAARKRSSARICCITGSVGKTGTKDALALALGASGRTAASAGNLNNHWGAPLSLARMPADTEYGVFELGMNHAGEIRPLSQLARPHVAIITNVAPAHLAFFENLAAIADAKAEIFDGVEPDGVAILNRDNPFFERLADRARRAGIGRIIGFGADDAADARLLAYEPDGSEASVRARILDREMSYRLSAVGEHWAANSLAVLAAAAALGADVERAAEALQRAHPGPGRGQHHVVSLPGGDFEVIDDSYNASPVSMRAALCALADSAATGRRIAVLGDMLELGATADALHEELGAEVLAAGVDLTFTAGAHMAALHEALPTQRRGRHANGSQAVLADVLASVRPGDVVLVKGSLGSRMALIVEALRALGRTKTGGGAAPRRLAPIAAEGRAMFYFLGTAGDDFIVFNLFRYLTFRSGAAVVTALVVAFLMGPWVIEWLKRHQPNGQPIRDDGPRGHFDKAGTPTMGGFLILLASIASTLLWADLRNGYVWATLLVMVGFGAIGFADDYLKLARQHSRGLPGRLKLLCQIVIAAVATVWIMSVTRSPLDSSFAVPFFKDILFDFGWMFLPVAAFVMVGASNAVNLTDGLDGLAIVPVMIAAGCFALIAYLVGNTVFANYLQIHYVAGTGELAVFCGSLIGAGLGFLWFNAPPAMVFMGDTGSLSMGGALGTIAVITKHELVLAIVGGLFVLETVSVIVQVASFRLTGRRVFRMAPLHHHFEQKGWAESTIVIRFWIIATILALVGLSTLKLR